MANYYDPRWRGFTPGGQQGHAAKDYQQLAVAYRELLVKGQEMQVHFQRLQNEYQTLQARNEKQAKQIHELEQELEIKQEALRLQSEDLKKMESELLWTKAAVQQQEQMQQEAAAREEQTWQERYVRLQAEMENMRRRWDQRSQQQIEQARDRILLDMLPLADHLDLALQHTDNLTEPAAQEFVSSIDVTRRAFMDTLKGYGVERLTALEQPFDPNLHEAVGQIADDSIPADHVAQVIQGGYRQGERLLRPARVLVSSGGGRERNGVES